MQTVFSVKSMVGSFDCVKSMGSRRINVEPMWDSFWSSVVDEFLFYLS